MRGKGPRTRYDVAVSEAHSRLRGQAVLAERTRLKGSPRLPMRLFSFFSSAYCLVFDVLNHPPPLLSLTGLLVFCPINPYSFTPGHQHFSDSYALPVHFWTTLPRHVSHCHLLRT